MSLTLETLQQTRSNIGLVNFTKFLRSLSSEPDERIYQARYTVFKILQQGTPRLDSGTIKRQTTFQRAVPSKPRTSIPIPTPIPKIPTPIPKIPTPIPKIPTPSSAALADGAAPAKPSPIVETRVGAKTTGSVSEARILSPEVVIGGAINVGSLVFLSYGLRPLTSTAPSVSNDRARQLTNSYINIPDKGAQHVLAYLYENWPDNNTLPIAAALLLLRGADISAPAFRSPDQLSQRLSTVAVPTVEEIIRRNVDEKGLQLPLSLRTSLVDLPARDALDEFFSPTEIDTIAVYLDDSTIASLQDLSSTDLAEIFNLIVEMQSYHVLDKAYKLYQPTDPTFLGFIVRAINPYAYRSTIQISSFGPDYFLLNEILIRASRTNASDLIAVTDAYSDMLVDSINQGYELDQYQVRMAEKNLPKVQYQRILDALSKPVWRKVCHNKRTSEVGNERITDIRILEMARGLGLDITQTQNYVCQQLEGMSDVDPRRLVTRAVNNEKKKFLLETQGTDLGKFTPLSPEALQNAHCDNKSFNFEKTGTIYFRDSIGNWCLSPDTFSTAILDKINPYSSAPLSERVLDNINARLDILRKLDLPENPLTFEEAVNRLVGSKVTNANQINSDLTQNAIRIFETNSANYGVRSPRDILRKKEDPILFLTEAVNYLDPDNVFNVMLNGLTVEHAYGTMTRLANEVFEQQPELAESFFRTFFTSS